MEKQLFAELPLRDRIEMLEANAEKMEEMTYFKPLTPEELEKERLSFAQQSIEISSKQDKLKEITDAFKLELKPMIEQAKQTLTEIKTKNREVKEMVYNLADYEEGMMGTYNNMGELIMYRRLTPEERQMSIHSSRTMKIAQNQ